VNLPSSASEPADVEYLLTWLALWTDRAVDQLVSVRRSSGCASYAGTG
jgi:hypothetical protein